jgi:hypothetical protein
MALRIYVNQEVCPRLSTCAYFPFDIFMRDLFICDDTRGGGIAAGIQLEQLRDGLREASEILRSGAYLIAIAYHSTEDKLIRHFLRARSNRAMGN